MDDAYILREWTRRQLIPKVDVYQHLFPNQLEFVHDASPLVAALCTRRAGKSESGGARLVRAGLDYPGSLVPYIALTRASARTIMWPILHGLNRRYDLRAEMLESKLTMRLPNGSEIFCVGADQTGFMERLRGGKYPVAVIDEAQAYRDHVRVLIDDILGPAVADYMGQIYMLGTPGVRPAGLFYEVTERKQHGWSNHRWSFLDNPFMHHMRDWLRSLMAKKGWTEAYPTYRREWLGQWVIDLDALVYKFMSPRNEYADLPAGHDWHRILSIDYGFHDRTAFGILAYSLTFPKVFVEHVEAHHQRIPSQAAARVKQLVAHHQPVKIVADTGGLGKSITEEMVRRYHIPIHAAQKTDKLTWIELVNGDFIDGNLQVHRSLDELKHQYSVLVKNDKGLEDPGLPNDMADVVLYGYREARAYAWEPKAEPPKTKEDKWKKQEQELEEAEEEALNREDVPWYEREA